MVDIIFLILLLIGFFVGFRRGLILQIVYLTSFVASFVIAYLFFDDVAPYLKLWIPYPTSSKGGLTLLMDSLNLEEAYYLAISFALLFFVSKITLRIIGKLLDFLADLPILSTVNGWLGGFVGLAEVYLLLFIVIYVGALIPVDAVQAFIGESLIAGSILKHTPFLSSFISDLWFDHISSTG